VTVDLEGRYTFVSPKYVKRFGYQEGKLIGVPSLSTIYEPDWPICQQVVAECLQHPGRGVWATLRKPTPEGEIVYTQWEFSALLGENGEPVGIICLGHDITEKQVALTGYRESVRHLDEVLGGVTDSYCVLDKDWRFLEVNQACLNVVGCTRDALIGRRVQDLFPVVESLKATSMLRQAMDEQCAIRFEEVYEGRCFLVTVHPSPDRINIFFQEVTEQLKVEGQLQQQPERIRQFSFTTSHELRHELAKIQLLWNAQKQQLPAEGDASAIDAAIHSLQQILTKMNQQLNVGLSLGSFASEFKLRSVQEICFVDDDPVMNTFNPRIVQKQYPEAQLLTFESVDEGLFHIERHPNVSRCIFLDLNFPERSGWEFLSDPRFRSNPVPVIILSSSIDPRDQERARLYQEVVTFLHKPLRADALQPLL